MTRPDWIHTPDDGRGFRRVFVDSVEIEKVFYADTKVGFCDICVMPLRVIDDADHGRKVETRRLYGRVVVKPDERPQNIAKNVETNTNDT